jgi:hypothetical protein
MDRPRPRCCTGHARKEASEAGRDSDAGASPARVLKPGAKTSLRGRFGNSRSVVSKGEGEIFGALFERDLPGALRRASPAFLARLTNTLVRSSPAIATGLCPLEIDRLIVIPGSTSAESRFWLSRISPARSATRRLAGVSVALPSAASIAKPETPDPNRLGKIAMEEHFMVPDFMEYFAETYPNINADIAKLAPDALMDFGERRLAVMDEHHVDYVVLSLAGPGVQAEKDGAVAQRKARALNDFLAGEIQNRPVCYGGFAHLAMQNPSIAAEELERCMRDLGFHGALINGQTNGEYLDLDKYSVFWERAAALDAPIYLHPCNPVDHPATYADHSELWGPVCSWAFETATHALRLEFAGVFERYPKGKTHSRSRRGNTTIQHMAL